MQRFLSNVWVAIDKHVVIRSILLQVLVFDGPWDVGVSGGHDKRLRDAGTIFSVPLTDVLERYKATII